MDTYAERLTWAMNRRDPPWGQTELALKADVTPQAVQYLCDTKRNARGSKHTAKLAETLGVSAHWLSTGKGDPDDPPGAAGYRAVPEIAAAMQSLYQAVDPVILDDWNLLLEDDQARIAAEIHRLAESARAYQRRFGSGSADTSRVNAALPAAPTTKEVKQ